jgi:hypothetical protein
MRYVLVLAFLHMAVLPAAAADEAEQETFSIFEAACLHDSEQFNEALALATERSMPVAPKPIRDALSRDKEAAVWIASEAPFVVIHAELAAGCGVMLKPASENEFQSILAAVEGLEAVSKDKFENSWSVWYRLTREGNRGIMLAGFLAESDKPSAFLRYMPAEFVAAHDEAGDFLLTDNQRFMAIRESLAKD